MSNVPWYVPTLIDSKVVGYAGPFANEADRDAYASAYDGPDTLGTAIQAVSDPNLTLPQQTAIVAASDGDKVFWTDGTMTDA
jgi:hypothetical protein